MFIECHECADQDAPAKPRRRYIGGRPFQLVRAFASPRRRLRAIDMGHGGYSRVLDGHPHPGIDITKHLTAFTERLQAHERHYNDHRLAYWRVRRCDPQMRCLFTRSVNAARTIFTN